MMGHQIEGSRASYFVENSTELKAAYKDCVDYLTIQKELDISESEDFKRIKAENETLILEAEKHRVERSELQELRAELEAKAERETDLNNKVTALNEMYEAMNEVLKNSQTSDKIATKTDVIYIPTPPLIFSLNFVDLVILAVLGGNYFYKF